MDKLEARKANRNDLYIVLAREMLSARPLLLRARTELGDAKRVQVNRSAPATSYSTYTTQLHRVKDDAMKTNRDETAKTIKWMLDTIHYLPI